MTETVRILDRNEACITIFEAMVRACPDKDIINVFGIETKGNDSVAEVKMTVNGIEVPVLETLNHFWGQYDDHLNKAAQEKVKETVMGAGLQNLVNALQNAEWMVNDALAAFEKAQGV